MASFQYPGGGPDGPTTDGGPLGPIKFGGIKLLFSIARVLLIVLLVGLFSNEFPSEINWSK